MQDRWIWSRMGTGDFSVASVRSMLDDHKLSVVSSQTRCIKVLPIKINMFAWKVRSDKLPSRLNLSLKGLPIPSILCPICDEHVESTTHIFFSCSMMKDLVRKVSIWWHIGIPDIASYDEWLNWISNIQIRVQANKF
ncbi:RNA-directed DNA polymerase, eukaryota [Tanacetum coccineum]